MPGDAAERDRRVLAIDAVLRQHLFAREAEHDTYAWEVAGIPEAAEALAALASSSGTRVEERTDGRVPAAPPMQTELRPFADQPRRPGLDEIVADNVACVHAEMMSDTSLWIGLSDEHDGLVHAWIGIEKHRGRHVLVMKAEDQGRPTIVPELDRLKAWRAASAMEAGTGETAGLDPKGDSAAPSGATPDPHPSQTVQHREDRHGG